MNRFFALAKAETLQLFRNKSLITMAILVPLGIPLFMLNRTGNRESALEFFYCFMLLYVVFYSVLVMAVSRRDEGMLKRLRTSSASKAEILSALVAPSVVLGLLLSAVMFSFAAPALPQLVGLLPMMVVAIGLAFICTAFTKNAEAAMITSAPGFILLMAGMGSIRSMTPTNIQRVLDYTPYALFQDASWDNAAKLGMLCLWAAMCAVGALRYFKWDSYR